MLTFQLFQQISANKKTQKSSDVEYKLNLNELLFIPKQYDPTPLRHPSTKFSNDLAQKRNYTAKFSQEKFNEPRKQRTKEDARYLNRKGINAQKLSLLNVNDERMLCLDHLTRGCRAENCDKFHQLRRSRRFGVCKFYLAGFCNNGDLCQYMHEEFPCRYYYLNLPHPKASEMDVCRFKHGGPLSHLLRNYFEKQITEWVKKLTIKEPQLFDSRLANLMEKFDEKQIQLNQEYGVKDSREASSSICSEKFSFEHILSADQIKELAKRDVTNAAQLNRTPVDELIDCGLTMDQIYKITISTCNESNSIPMDDDVISSNSNLSNNDLVLNDLSSSMEIVEETNSFEGFCLMDFINANEELVHNKKIIYDTIAVETVKNTSDSNDHECNRIEIEHIGNAIVNSSDDSADSDDESNLLIDEDI